MQKLIVHFLSLFLIVFTFSNLNNLANADTNSSLLYGNFYGPINTHIILQNNGSDDLDLVINPLPGSNDAYNSTPFQFPNSILNGTTYSLTIKDVLTDGVFCHIFKGQSGTLPLSFGAIHVGCEKLFDFVSLGNTPSERGTFYYSSHPGTGGAKAPIGTTADGYGEGRFVIFSSSLPLAGSKGLHRQVFFRDRLAGETRLISKDINGNEGNADSVNPSISADGLHVAFESYATNLDGKPDTNGVRDIFIWDAQRTDIGLTKISVGFDGNEANSESFDANFSGDGSIVAFSSSASNLTPGVIGTGTLNVYRHEVRTKLTDLVSFDLKGAGAGGAYPSMSEDGSKIAFYSYSSKITADDSNNLWDIFVYDNTTKLNKRISLTTTGGERNSGSESVSHTVPPTISGNGRYVAFSTTATNMVPGVNNGKRNVYVADLATNTVQWASSGMGGVQGNGNTPVGQSEKVTLSYDGRWIAFTTNSGNITANKNPGNENIVMRNLDSGETIAVTEKEGYSFSAPVLSRDASYILFGSNFRFDDAYPSSGFFSHLTGVGKPFFWLP
jgi:Tol biopolymer transport system component